MRRRHLLLRPSALCLAGMPVLWRAGPAEAADQKTSIAAIKEALAIGTEAAVKNLGREDGYFANAAVKILLPGSVQRVAELATRAGLGKQVDELVLGMNRAAERAAPLAAPHFAQAIRGMGIADVQAILKAGDTGATAFFERTTREPLHAAFRPQVRRSLDQVGAGRAYKELVERVERIPLLGKPRFDLDEHVTHKALNGLFFVVGEEEKKIRRNPLPYASQALKAVFGR